MAETNVAVKDLARINLAGADVVVEEVARADLVREDAYSGSFSLMS